jgi:hypothetical protein
LRFLIVSMATVKSDSTKNIAKTAIAGNSGTDGVDVIIGGEESEGKIEGVEVGVMGEAEGDVLIIGIGELGSGVA